MAVVHWSQLQERGTLWGIKSLLLVYSILGRVPFLMVLYPVVFYYFLFNAVARRASVEYIKKVRKIREFRPGQWLYWVSFAHFLSFAQSLLDKFVSWGDSFGYENVDFPDREEFFRLMDKKQGAIIIGSHLGNLEVMRALSKYNATIKLNILVHTKHAEMFNRLIQKADSNARLTMIQVTEINPGTAIQLQDKLAAGEFVVIAGDRIPVHMPRTQQRISMVDFMGELAPFSQGPYLIAALLKSPVYTLFCLRDQGKYKIHFQHFCDRIKLKRGDREQSLQQYAQQYAQVLESQALTKPLQWHNYFPFWQQESATDHAA